MIAYFKGEKLFAVETNHQLEKEDITKLQWLFGDAQFIHHSSVAGAFIGPRKEMITPWSTNAVEITQNTGIVGILRIEELVETAERSPVYDPMLQRLYINPDQTLFQIDLQPEPIRFLDDIETYNSQEGLALTPDEVAYLEDVSRRIGRNLTDSEVYGFAQVNSEHCRHKIFNGSFVIDGVEMPETLFSMIKKTSKSNPNTVVSAYKDNVAFLKGPEIEQFAPKRQDKADFFVVEPFKSLISLKAETHNFPTTVEPFNGAATGSGGEIRDRLAGGTGSLPLSGSAVYMTSYPRHAGKRAWETAIAERPWLYQTPLEILIKASNGASDFGNKFGQPLINGSLLTFEHQEDGKVQAFDKVIMLAGGIGYAKARDAHKKTPQVGDRIVVMGGDNYRIGMGGGAVSSVATGEFNNEIELNAVQRSNPEMQKRVANAIRAMVEDVENPIVSIHDHGAGGHLNSLSELVEETGGVIDLDKLPVGDPTLSAREIIGNESQERMGLVISPKSLDYLETVARRERAPFYNVGKITGDMRFCFKAPVGSNPIDLELGYLFGKPPKTVLEDTKTSSNYASGEFSEDKINEYIVDVLKLESVACKDWLTNKVDRSVTGKVAQQQCVGVLQLPLSNLGAMALDYRGKHGIATSVGHAPATALVDEAAGSRLSVVEALTNIVWAPLADGLKSVSLSANWMWPAKNHGENARLYNAVKALSDYTIELGINVPTGKDSLSMAQKYSDQVVLSPGTVIVSASAHTSDIQLVVTPDLKYQSNSEIIYIDLSNGEFGLGGSSLAQVNSVIGGKVSDAADAKYFATAFNVIQQLLREKMILAGHDISSGGLITTLLEMCFSSPDLTMNLNLDGFGNSQLVEILFSERPSLVLQVENAAKVLQILHNEGINAISLGNVTNGDHLKMSFRDKNYSYDIIRLREIWFSTSYHFDRHQVANDLADSRFANFSIYKLHYRFPENFSGEISESEKRPKAAIIREKGVNGDREMAWSLYAAGFEVKDIHMTDLMSGRENLSDVLMIVFVGGFSNSDVLGSAKGWAGAFMYNPLAKKALSDFYQRADTMSLGVCNGCQLMVELGLINPDHEVKPKMEHNESHKFESSFLNVEVEESSSIMLKSLEGSRLGIWVAHGEGKFDLPFDISAYEIPLKYGYEEYPANPNGSDYNAAAICSADGRHLAMMPHLERAIYPWQWAHYPENRTDEVSPWIEAFVNARNWLNNK
ncbi:MAG: phosphoribosylformylglycinamidine synthase [Bacteroidales bacterium]|nr:phosphoribosylformylglycinamidine synthase [Bacteroidales bacterium]